MTSLLASVEPLPDEYEVRLMTVPKYSETTLFT